MIVPVTVTASACVVVVRPLVCVEPVCANASGAISAQQARVTIFLFIFMFMNRDNPQRCTSQVTNRKACVTKWRKSAQGCSRFSKSNRNVSFICFKGVEGKRREPQ